MRQFTIYDIRSWNPCYDPSKQFNEVFTEQWSGTALDFLKLAHIPAQDRLWAVLREELIDESTFRMFAVWCARQALALVDNPDPRSIAACDVAERYANKEATQEEINSAASNARDVADAFDAATTYYNYDTYRTYAAYICAYAATAPSFYAVDAYAAAAYAALRPFSDIREKQVERLIQMLETK